MVVELYYKKNKNTTLFNDLEKYGFENTQNYIPIYQRFFQLNKTNWDNINLNNKSIIKSLHSRNDGKHEIYKVYNQNNKITTCFFKLAPLVDPIRYMSGKYKDISENDLFELPSFEKETMKNKDDPNNVCYVDSFFYYISSKLLNDYSFIHGTDFYGSYLSLKNNYSFNVYDDIDYLQENYYFLENCGNNFHINNVLEDEIINFDTRKNKKQLHILTKRNNSNSISISSLAELSELNEIFRENNDDTTDIENINELTNSDLDLHISNMNEIENMNKSTCDTYDNNDDDSKSDIDTDSDSSSCSSRTSNTSNGSTNTIRTTDNDMENVSYDSNSINESDNGDDCDEDSDEDSDDEYIEAIINKFPVQIICIENMEHTLDYYIENYDIHNDEWSAILMQLIMILITYQKCFDFTHNDLHTNNIMYNETQEQYIYYYYKGRYYKVPTYGKVFKIIDFGRAIYKFQGRLICSDSYAEGNDAATQYNFGPYYNTKKTLLEPNKSFDLCRLACSLYDHFIESEEDTKNVEKDSIIEVILKWIKDDNGKNVLYKSNGKERYPGFKLYKMIARDVHNHIPENQLKMKIFNQFQIHRKNVKSKTNILNIDKIPVMV